MAAQRVVTGPVVVLPDGNGLIRYYYQGAVLPEGLDEERVKSAIADGLVSEDKDAGELTIDDLNVALAGDRLRAAGRPSGEDGLTDEEESDDRPPKTANKDVWIDFRVAESDGRLTKEQLSAEGVATKAQLQDDEFVAALPAADAAPPQS